MKDRLCKTMRYGKKKNQNYVKLAASALGVQTQVRATYTHSVMHGEGGEG